MKNAEKFAQSVANVLRLQEDIILKRIKNLKKEDLFDFPEEEEVAEMLKKYNNSERNLQNELLKGKVNIDLQINDFKDKVQKLKIQKSKIAFSLTECLSGGGDGADLYVELHQTNQELRDLEELIRVLSRESQYPATPKVKELGKEAFEAGLKVVISSSKMTKNLEAINSKMLLIQNLIKAFLNNNASTLSQVSSIQAKMVKDFIHFNPEYAFMDWNEVEKIALTEIDKQLNKGAK